MRALLMSSTAAHTDTPTTSCAVIMTRMWLKDSRLTFVSPTMVTGI